MGDFRTADGGDSESPGTSQRIPADGGQSELVNRRLWILRLSLGVAEGLFPARRKATSCFGGGLAIVLLVTPFLLYGVFRWASSDEGIERGLSRERFRAEQELRGLRRSSWSDLDSNGAPKKSDSSDLGRLPADTFTR